MAFRGCSDKTFLAVDFQRSTAGEHLQKLLNVEPAHLFHIQGEDRFSTVQDFETTFLNPAVWKMQHGVLSLLCNEATATLHSC